MEEVGTLEKSEDGWEGDLPQRRQLRLLRPHTADGRSGSHSRRPCRPELTREWNIPVAWEPQPAFKAPCEHVALNAFDSSLVPLPLL